VVEKENKKKLEYKKSGVLSDLLQDRLIILNKLKLESNNQQSGKVNGLPRVLTLLSDYASGPQNKRIRE
jgi:hypothetical protein